MNITFTKEELATFATALDGWHARRTDFICTAFISHGRDAHLMSRFDPGVFLSEAAKRFESENPKPDWRSLL